MRSESNGRTSVSSAVNDVTYSHRKVRYRDHSFPLITLACLPKLLPCQPTSRPGRWRSYDPGKARPRTVWGPFDLQPTNVVHPLCVPWQAVTLPVASLSTLQHVSQRVKADVKKAEKKDIEMWEIRLQKCRQIRLTPSTGSGPAN